MEYWDMNNVVESSFEKGKLEGKREIAKELKRNNVSMDIISKSTGLTIEEIEKL